LEGDVDLQLEYHHNLITKNKPDKGQSKEYSPSNAMLMAKLIYNLNTRAVREGAPFAQQYLLNKGLKISGQKGQDASKKEMDQLHQRSCFTPKSTTKMTQIEQRKVQQALMLVYNGNPTREWPSREDSVSPTAALESRMLTSFIDAHEERKVMTCNIPNAFIQALMPKVKDRDETY
jgi:hypothetical protein